MQTEPLSSQRKSKAIQSTIKVFTKQKKSTAAKEDEHSNAFMDEAMGETIEDIFRQKNIQHVYVLLDDVTPIVSAYERLTCNRLRIGWGERNKIGYYISAASIWTVQTKSSVGKEDL